MMQMIDQLCTECSALIENHEKIQVLSAVHYNLGKTLQVMSSRRDKVAQDPDRTLHPSVY